MPTTVQCANPAGFSIAPVAGTDEVRLSNGGGANVPGADTILSPALQY